MTCPTRVEALWVFFLDSGKRHHVDPYLIAAICDRETLCGASLDAHGTGDHSARHGKQFTDSHLYRFTGKLPKRHSDGSVTLEDCFMPEDGFGWGRGLMQIDYASHQDFLTKTDPGGAPLWKKPGDNIDLGAQLLTQGLFVFADQVRSSQPASVAWPEMCAVAAYNAGGHNVTRAVELTDPKCTESLLDALDRITTNGDYVSDVLERKTRFMAPHQPKGPPPPVKPAPQGE